MKRKTLEKKRQIFAGKNIFTPKAGLLLFLLSATLFFTSCTSSITIKRAGNKTWISFSAEGGEKFIKTIKMLDSSSFEEERGGQTSSQELFNPAVIQENFKNSGFTGVRAEKIADRGFTVSFEMPESADNPLTRSKIFNYSELKKPYFSLSRENFQIFYEEIPFELKSYIDLFMAPSFTDEEMDDEEYLDLVASVFGPSLADEIKEAKINFIFDDNGKISRKTFSLLSILNLEGKLTIGM